MRGVARIIAALFSTLVIMSLPGEAAVQSPDVGLVEKIRGTVLWKANASARPVRLDPKVDKARVLHTGEQVRCLREGKLRIRFDGKALKLTPLMGWVTVSETAFSKRREESRKANLYRKLIKGVAYNGGGNRTGYETVYSPSKNSIVTPDTFFMAWNPHGVTRDLTVIIRDSAGRVVWKKESINGATGFLESSEVRQNLKKYRAKFGQGPLSLIMVKSYGDKITVDFSLLSVQGEQSLKQDLDFWGLEAGRLIRHMGRAALFADYEMYPQAAEEYEAALKLAPESFDLLKRTIQAHCDTGNFARIEHLKRRLPAGTKASC